MDILHCDLNNFFASVEILLNPELADKFVAVTGDPSSRRGIVLAKNTAAKLRGVKTGEPIWQAKQKCPQLVCVKPHFEYYVHFSNRVRAIYEEYTDLVESFGMDECWLDVTHSKLFGTPLEIAEKIRREVREKTGLTISVGISFNKTFAKLGSDLKKPDATTVISKENFQEIVWQLDVSEMLFVGARTKQLLNEMGIYTLGQLANADSQALKLRLGAAGESLKNCASGLDCDPVKSADSKREVKSIGNGTTTLRDMTTYDDAGKVISLLSEMVAARLRDGGFLGGEVHLDVRRNDLSHKTAQMPMHPSCSAIDISAVACRLLFKVWNCKTDKPLRSLTVTATKLVAFSQGVQASLFDSREEKRQQLECSLDIIRKKFGFNSILRGSSLQSGLVNKRAVTTEEETYSKRQL